MGLDDRAARAIRLLAVATALFAATGADAAEIDHKDILGWVERVIVGAHEIEVKAKLDTGAETSSLDASEIRRLRRKSSGERFVEFQVTDPGSGDTILLKKPLVRMVRIKQHDGSFQTRPVVKLPICLGTHSKEIEVSLIDRSEFLYPLLIGRKALAGIAVVDPDRTLTTEPDCDNEEESAP